MNIIVIKKTVIIRFGLCIKSNLRDHIGSNSLFKNDFFNLTGRCWEAKGGDLGRAFQRTGELFVFVLVFVLRVGNVLLCRRFSMKL